MALALTVRLWSVSETLPRVYHVDELFNDRLVVKVAHDPFSSPRFFRYPSLLFYAQASVTRAYEVLTARTAEPARVASRASAWVDDPTRWILGRSLSALVGSLSVGFAVWAARRAGASPWTCAVTGTWAALSPLAVTHSRYMTPDIYGAFFAMVAIALAMGFTRDASLRVYAYGGAAVGLAAGSKYNLAVVAAPLVCAHLIEHGVRGFLDRRIYVAGGAALLAFLASTPFALLDFHKFLAGVRFEAKHYATGHAGVSGSAFEGYSGAILQSESWRLWFVPLAFLARDPRARSRALILASFVVPYLLFLSQFKVHFPRNAVPLMLPLVVLAGLGFASLIDWARTLYPIRWTTFTAVALAVLLCVGPASKIRAEAASRGLNVRLEAEQFVARNVPLGSRIALEAHSPWVEPKRYDIVSITRVPALPGGFLERERVRYLLLSEFEMKRNRGDANAARQDAKAYAEVRARSCEVLENGKGTPGFVLLDLSCKRAKGPRRAGR